MIKRDWHSIWAWAPIRQAIIGLCLMVCAFSVWGNTAASPNVTTPNRVALDTGADYYYPLVDDVMAYKDDTRDLTLNDLLHQPELFAPIETKYIDFGLTPARIWLWSRLENESDQANTWRLDLNRQYIHEINVYLIRDDGLVETVLEHTEYDAFHMRPIADNLIGLDIPLNAKETIDVYISYRSTATTYLPIGIGTPSGVSNVHVKATSVDWVLNGALLAFMAFAVLMVPVIGWRLAVSFSLYILAALFYVSNADGYTFQYLWPNYPQLNDPLNLFFMLMMSVFGLSFARVLFDFKLSAPVFDKALLAVICVAIIFSLFALAFVKIAWFQTLAYSWVPVGTLMQLLSGLVAFRKKLLGAIPYLMGALFVLSSIIYATIAHVRPGAFNLDLTLDYGHFALIAESFAFAIAIVLRLQGLRHERDKALKAELIATQDKLDLSSKLQKTQADYMKARKLSDRRQKALSSVSHDIRQPLASLRVALQKIDDAETQNVEQMHKAFDYLESLAIENIATHKRSHQDEGDATGWEVFSVKIVLDNVQAMFADEAAAKGLAFQYDPLDIPIKSDPLQLMRAVNNLMSNAIKHTEKGGVELKVSIAESQVRIHVNDSGQGMSDENLKRAMMPYAKGEHSEGTGLGLPIVKDICNDLNIMFDIESIKGEGTRTKLTIEAVNYPVDLKG